MSIESAKLVIFAMNERDIFHRKITAVERNLSKKFKNGTYEHKKAAKAWLHVAEAVARRYWRVHGDGSCKWFSVFRPQMRLDTAAAMADAWFEEMKNGHFTE